MLLVVPPLLHTNDEPKQPVAVNVVSPPKQMVF